MLVAHGSSLPFFRIRECLYYADADKALAPLWPLLERMGIEKSC